MLNLKLSATGPAWRYTCQICGEVYWGRRTAYRHMEAAHGVKASKSKLIWKELNCLIAALKVG